MTSELNVDFSSHALTLDERPGEMSYVGLATAILPDGRVITGRSKAYGVDEFDAQAAMMEAVDRLTEQLPAAGERS